MPSGAEGASSKGSLSHRVRSHRFFAFFCCSNLTFFRSPAIARTSGVVQSHPLLDMSLGSSSHFALGHALLPLARCRIVTSSIYRLRVTRVLISLTTPAVSGGIKGVRTHSDCSCAIDRSRVTRRSALSGLVSHCHGFSARAERRLASKPALVDHILRSSPMQ